MATSPSEPRAFPLPSDSGVNTANGSPILGDRREPLLGVPDLVDFLAVRLNLDGKLVGTVLSDGPSGLAFAVPSI